jgi:pteridine reductase
VIIASDDRFSIAKFADAHYHMPRMKLDALTAIVTGSTGNLGGVLTLALAKAGCNCVCHYHSNQKRAQELVGEIQTLGKKAVAVYASLDSTENIKTLFDQLERVCRQADIDFPRLLVNSAAVFKKQPLSDVTFEDARKTVDLNLIAPIVISRFFAQTCNGKTGDHPYAKIVNIADIGGLRPWAGYSVYCSSKAALIAATKSLAKELAPQICVNAVAPGIFSWPHDFDEEAKNRQLSFVPMKRIAAKEEIAAALLFLLENDYVTGQVLRVDGGRGI